MPKQLHHRPQLLALIEQERGEGVPQVVQVQPVQPGRAAEGNDPQGRKWPRGKTHDDATLAYCTQLGEPLLQVGGA
ncbi:hypothetical protein [Micromonospora saelicesensis]|uniref:hypothetical protein n=1 Tax=Micromonospora saelicesensis TaxID=285676 RepID=UPI0021ACA3D5|nr:hypothetical protein [Micromonospora saelicesensis]